MIGVFWFMFALFLGAFLGVVVMALAVAADEDRDPYPYYGRGQETPPDAPPIPMVKKPGDPPR